MSKDPQHPIPSDTRTTDDSAAGRLSRRHLLGALAPTIGLSMTTDIGSAEHSIREESTISDVHVRVYPVSPAGVMGSLLTLTGTTGGWDEPFLDAFAAIEIAMESIVEFAQREHDLESPTVRIERTEPIEIRSRDIPVSHPLLSQQGLLDAFYDTIETDLRRYPAATHVLLWWHPFQHRVGYGGTRSPNSHVVRQPDIGAQTVANIGATEFWDDRSVTRNMAIHETLHTFLSSDVVESVVDSRCDHDLGSLVRVDDRTASVSPMATAYAGPDGFGAGTRWPGSGCHDHDRFYRHDGTAGIERWVYTPQLSDGILEATARYLKRHMR